MGITPNESQDPAVALMAGRGRCHNSAAVTISVAQSKGWDAVMVDLGEHVVAEVDAGEGPWVVDGDFGLAQHVSVSALVARPDLRQAWLDEMRARDAPLKSIEIVARALAEPQQHRRIEGWSLSPRLAVAERLGYWLSLVVPALLLLSSCAGIRRWLRRTSGR